MNYVGEVLEHCKTCRASDKASNVPIAGTIAASMFNGNLQADLLFLGNTLALHSMDTFDKNPLLLQE